MIAFHIRQYLINYFFSYSDYCTKEEVNDERKGRYFFPNTDVFETIYRNCQHGSMKGFRIKRICKMNMLTKQAYWEEIDLTYCLTPNKDKGIIEDIEIVSLNLKYFGCFSKVSVVKKVLNFEFQKKITKKNAENRLVFISNTLENKRQVVESPLDFHVVIKATKDIISAIKDPLNSEVS